MNGSDMHRDINFNFGPFPAMLLELKADVEHVDHQANAYTAYKPPAIGNDGNVIVQAETYISTSHKYHIFFELEGGGKYQHTFDFNPKMIKGHDVVLYFVYHQDQTDTGQACAYYNRSLDLSYCWMPEKFKGVPLDGAGSRFTYCAFFGLIFATIAYVMWGVVIERGARYLPTSEYVWVGAVTLYTFYLFIRAMTHMSRFRKRKRMMKDLETAVMGMVRG